MEATIIIVIIVAITLIFLSFVATLMFRKNIKDFYVNLSRKGLTISGSFYKNNKH